MNCSFSPRAYINIYITIRIKKKGKQNADYLTEVQTASIAMSLFIWAEWLSTGKANKTSVWNMQHRHMKHTTQAHVPPSYQIIIKKK